VGIVVVRAARGRTSPPSSDRGRSGRASAPSFQGTREDSLADTGRVDQKQDAGTALFPGCKEVSAAVRAGVRSIEDSPGPVSIVDLRSVNGNVASSVRIVDHTAQSGAI